MWEKFVFLNNRQTIENSQYLYGMERMVIMYQLHISLNEIKPLIWRRMMVDSGTSLFYLHNYIQLVFGWKNYHLYRFDKNGVEFSDPRLYEGEPVIDVKVIPLDTVLKEPGDSLIYEYDFGDGWSHTLRLEEVKTCELRASKPVCLEGANATPPEDVGGLCGFEEFREVISNPSHTQYKEFRRWAGHAYDPSFFSLKKANTMLGTRKRYIQDYDFHINYPGIR